MNFPDVNPVLTKRLDRHVVALEPNTSLPSFPSLPHMLDISFTPINGKMSEAANSTTAIPVPVANPSTTTPALPVERPLPEKWTKGKPHSAPYFYDEPEDRDAQDFLPPNGLDLSDRWVVLVLKANVRTKERHERWPTVFSSKYLASLYQNKGTASKSLDASNGRYFYDVIFGTEEMHGAEGRAAGYKRDLKRKSTSSCVIGEGRECRHDSTLLAVQTNPAATVHPNPTATNSTLPTDQPNPAVTDRPSPLTHPNLFAQSIPPIIGQPDRPVSIQTNPATTGSTQPIAATAQTNLPIDKSDRFPTASPVASGLPDVIHSARFQKFLKGQENIANLKRKVKIDEREGRAAKRQHTSTFIAKKISLSSDEEENYRKVITTL